MNLYGSQNSVENIRFCVCFPGADIFLGAFKAQLETACSPLHAEESIETISQR